jgi:hypothetical protein
LAAFDKIHNRLKLHAEQLLRPISQEALWVLLADLGRMRKELEGVKRKTTTIDMKRTHLISLLDRVEETATKQLVPVPQDTVPLQYKCRKYLIYS